MPAPISFEELLRQLGEEHRREVSRLQREIRRLHQDGAAMQKEDTHWSVASERSQSRGESRGFENNVPEDPAVDMIPTLHQSMGPKLQSQHRLGNDFTEAEGASHYLTEEDLERLGRSDIQDGADAFPDEDALNAAFALASATRASVEDTPDKSKASTPAVWVEAPGNAMSWQPDGDEDSLGLTSEAPEKIATAIKMFSNGGSTSRESGLAASTTSLRSDLGQHTETSKSNLSYRGNEPPGLFNWRRIIKHCKNRREDILVELHETWVRNEALLGGDRSTDCELFVDNKMSTADSSTVTRKTKRNKSEVATGSIQVGGSMDKASSLNKPGTMAYSKACIVARLKKLLVPLLHLFSMMNPNSVRRVSWDVAGMVLLAHDLVMFPMSVYNTGTDGMPDGYKNFEETLIVAAAIFWSFDMLVAFRTGYYSNEGYIEMNQYKVAIHYLKTWFCLDAVIVSIDWTSFAIGLGSTSGYMRLGKTVSRTLRVFRLLRFIKVSNTLKEMMERINSEYILTVVGLLKIVVLIVIVNHYIACMWYALSQFSEDEFGKTRWVEEHLYQFGRKDLGYAYFTSLHWSLTQFTPASMEVFPENVFERSFNVVVIILALVVFSSFVSSITSAMTHLRQINARKTEQETKIRRFFAEHKVSHELAGRVWHFLKRNQIHTGRRIKEEEVPSLKLLPLRIREELRMEVFIPVLRTHPLFEIYQNTCPAAMRIICNNALTEASALAGQELYRDVKHVDKMTFLVCGSLEYHHASNEEALHIRAPTWVGEVSVWAAKTRLNGPLVAAAGGCDLVLLDVDKFQNIVNTQTDGSQQLLVKYADLFVKKFNVCSQDEFYTNLLFNDVDIMQELADQALQTIQEKQRQTFGRESIIRTLFAGRVSGSRLRLSETI